MTQSISIKPGTWFGRHKNGLWRWFENEPLTYMSAWVPRVGKYRDIPHEMIDVAKFPTYHEPDWRKTKFQVQAVTDTGRLGTCQCCNKNKANSVICQDCIDEYMD